MSIDNLSIDTLETFTNIPVYAYGLPAVMAKSLRGIMTGFGLHLRKISEFQELTEYCSDCPEAIVFFSLSGDSGHSGDNGDREEILELTALKSLVEYHKLLLVVLSDKPLSEQQRELCLATGLVSDIWENCGHLPLLRQKCRLLLELQQRRNLQAKEQQLLQDLAYQKDRLLETMPDGVLMLTSDGYISDVNDFSLEALGYGRENLVGSHVSQLLCPSESRDPLLDWCEHPLYSSLSTQQDAAIEDSQLWRSDGSTLPVNVSLAVLYPGQAPEYLVVFQDISIRKAEEAELDQLTRYDPVTGLANVSLMRHFLLKAMARVLRNDRRLAVLYVDLDDFHCINENFGKAGGDSLLRSVGRRLKNCIRTGDMVSRYQGDAFMVILDEIRSAADVEKLAQQILEKLNTPHDLSGVPVVAHASIGIAFYPEGTTGIDDLIDQAKEAMEWVKLNGKNNRHVFGNDKLSAAKVNGRTVTH